MHSRDNRRCGARVLCRFLAHFVADFCVFSFSRTPCFVMVVRVPRGTPTPCSALLSPWLLFDALLVQEMMVLMRWYSWNVFRLSQYCWNVSLDMVSYSNNVFCTQADGVVSTFIGPCPRGSSLTLKLISRRLLYHMTLWTITTGQYMTR